MFNVMNFLMLFILCLTIVAFALMALGINFFLRKRKPLQDSPQKNEAVETGKSIRCGCGRGNCCAIE
jgi:hypothetical protein